MTTRPAVPRVLLAFGAAQLPLLLVPDVTLSPPGLALSFPVVYLAEALLLALLGLSLLGRGPRGSAGPYLLFITVLCLAAALGWTAGDGLPAAALSALLVGTLVGYGLHRYERVVLGLAGGEST